MNGIENAKKAAGYKAAELIKEEMLIGLGSGSTAFYFIEALLLRCRQGLRIKAVATSRRSQELALSGGIPLLDLESLSALDMCVDGADEIDPQKNMIKGGGGALLYEKIVASMSREMVVIVDETKCVESLGKFPLPVEIIPFGHCSTTHKIEQLGYAGKIRTQSDGSKYITDGGHFIYDLHLGLCRPAPAVIQEELLRIPGVVETGFFLNLAGRIIIGKSDGSVVVEGL